MKLWLDRAGQASLDVHWSYVTANQWKELWDLKERTTLLLSRLDRIAHLSIDFEKTEVYDLPDILRLTFSTIAQSQYLLTLDLHRFLQHAFCRQLNHTPDVFPNLRILTVDDSCVPWRSPRNLKRLELGWIYSERDDGTESSWEELQDLLASSPDLEELSIKHLDDFQNPSNMTSMQLPVFNYLHTLRLNAGHELCQLLLPSLRAPNLSSVTFRYNAYGVPSSIPMCLPNTLRHLKIASMTLLYDCLVFFLKSGLRDLVHLALEGDDSKNGSLTPELVEAMMCCDKLKHLDLWRVRVDSGSIEGLVKRRAEQNMALESICLRGAVDLALVDRLAQLGVKITQIVIEEDTLGLSGEGYDCEY
ncbi:hypothetical protein FRB93_007631 [Tulasnella sp. JGI-2019a]|nr:hypothetical protein FRB93_007631 [Tulasnella sp. JGI-2019a]